MKFADIHEAKTHLSRLVERAASGEEIVIVKAGKPMAKLVPFEARRARRKLGQWKGKVWMADDFDGLSQEIQDAFEGQSE